MNRTVRRRSVAVPWSLFPRELSVGQVLSLSLWWREHDCRTWAMVCASSLQGKRAYFSIPIFFMWLRSLQWPFLSRNIMVCSWRDSKRRVRTVRPTLEYGASAWTTAAKTHTNKLDQVQNMGLRTTLGAMKSAPIATM